MFTRILLRNKHLGYDASLKRVMVTFELDKFIHKNVKLIKYDSIGQIFALEKSSTILSHPNSSDDILNTLFQLPYDLKTESYKLPDNKKVYLLNRLDSATSGVILLSTDINMARYIKSLFLQRKIEKMYIAKVFGSFHKKSNSNYWENEIKTTKNNEMVRMKDSLSSNSPNITKIATTNVKLLSINDSKILPTNSLIELVPFTGYTHQLRYQCYKNGYPIIGDKIYGNYDLNKLYEKIINTNTNNININKNLNIKLIKNRLYLHSHRIKFDYEMDSKLYSFEAISPLPPEFYFH